MELQGATSAWGSTVDGRRARFQPGGAYARRRARGAVRSSRLHEPAAALDGEQPAAEKKQPCRGHSGADARSAEVEAAGGGEDVGLGCRGRPADGRLEAEPLAAPEARELRRVRDDRPPGGRAEAEALAAP